jgi:hypothetical protein
MLRSRNFLLRRAVEGETIKRDQKKSRPQLSLPRQYRVRCGQPAFPSFQRHSPKRTFPLAYGPLLPGHGTPELAVCIRLQGACNVLRAHPPESVIDPTLHFYESVSRVAGRNNECPLLTQSGHWQSEFAVMHNAVYSMVG